MTSTITTMATLALAGTTLAASGFRGSCSEFALTNLEGDKGRKMMLQARCDGNWSQLDLNTCFGWSADSCGFTFPPAGHFTDTVSRCTNNFSGGDEHFGTNFGCSGPCSGHGDAFNVFDLSKFNLPPALFLLTAARQLLTFAWIDSYVGNSNGNLVC